MIVRPHGSSRHLITQPDHAALARRIMERWQTDGLPRAPRRAQVLLAIGEHDNGWREPDAAPLLNASTGGVADFVSAPAAVRRGVWPRGVDRLAGTPWAAALVAHHAVHVYNRYRTDDEWNAFFGDLEATRDRHVAAAAPLTLDELLRDYFFVRLGDLASLTFCTGWTDPQREFGYEMRLEGNRLTIAPDPFGGADVPFAIAARELPHRAFASQQELDRAYAEAPPVTLSGVAAGEHRHGA